MQLFSIKFLIVIIGAVVKLVSSECGKTVSSVDFEVQCRRYSYDEVKIICRNGDWTKFPDIKLNLPFFTEIKFENCSYPAAINVHNIISNLNVNVVNRVTLASLRSIPNKQNLQGLSALQLDFTDSNFTKLPFDLLYDTVNFGIFNISKTQIEGIPEAFFRDWVENITEIFMNSNQLKKIARKDFAWLTRVNYMDLSGNKIEEIELGAFDTLINLDILLLGQNRLRALPSGILDQTTRLTTIDLSQNFFNELPQNLLINSKILELFFMKKNNGTLSTLPSGFFKNLVHLDTVNLANNQLKRLPSDLFTQCSKLSYIDISRNQLRNIPEVLFNDTKNLKTLHAYKNHLEALHVNIFQGLDHLEIVIIDNNRLTFLMPEVFKGRESVKSLHICNNALTRIDVQTIAHSKFAEYIDLSSNQITFGSQVEIEPSTNYNRSSSINNPRENYEKKAIQKFNFDSKVKLKTINLRNNSISYFNIELIHILKYCESVDLTENRISTINLFELPSGLDIVRIRNNVGGLPSPHVTIYLGKNPFHCDCNIIDFAHYLNGQGENRVYEIFATRSDDFGRGFKCAGPSEYKNQDVTKIPLQELSCTWKTSDPGDACTKTCICRSYPEKRTLYVDCSNRNLTRIPLILGNAHNWSIELNMSGNMLQHSPSSRDSYLTEVTSLDLSNNKITEVVIDLFSLKLQQLKLHGNLISRLGSDVIRLLDYSKTLYRITLHDNKWICDCAASQLITFIKKKFLIYTFNNVSCYGTNRKLHKIIESELCVDTHAIIAIVSLSIVVFGIVIASLVFLYYKYRCNIQFWLYSRGWCLWFVIDDEPDDDKKYDAFISFSHKDEDFVEKEIVAKLEDGPKPYKLCLHYRDWLAGEWIPVQISRSIADSRKTIVVLTQNFLESVWGLQEFRAAHIQALKEGKACLIVIIYGDIGNVDDLDQEIKDYLRVNTYIKWGDPWFWDKLRYALPRAKESMKTKTRNTDVTKNYTVTFSSVNNSVTHSTDNDDIASIQRHRSGTVNQSDSST